MILDYIEQLQIDDSEESKFANDLYALSTFKEGLCYLNNQVTKFENYTINKNLQTSSIGNLPDEEAEKLGIPMNHPKELIVCAFHWYSITACNYIRLIAHLCGKSENEYLKSIDGAMLYWRNKVSAHFAKIKPYKDNSADLVLSTMPQLTNESGRWYVGSLQLTLRSKDKEETSKFEPWSLTKTHERLSKRYRW